MHEVLSSDRDKGIEKKNAQLQVRETSICTRAQE